jgi:protein TonB
VRALASVILFSILISSYFVLTSLFNPYIPIPFIPATQVDPPVWDPPVKQPTITPPVTPPGGPKTNAVTTPMIVDSVIRVDSSLSKPITINNNPTGNSNDTSNALPGGPKVETGGGSSLIDSTFTGDFLEVPPSFPGGDKALFSFLQKNISYPESVKEVGGKGIVAITFVLDKEGNVTEVTALKASRYSELNQEAIRVVKKLPRWNPGKQQDHPVKARMIIPIRFELKQ